MQLRGLCRRSWERIRVYVGGLGSGSGPTWAVLRVDQGLCGRSWERIRAYLGGLGGGSGPMWAVLGADQGEKWPFLEREGDLAAFGAGRRSGKRIKADKWPFLEREACLAVRNARSPRAALRFFFYRYIAI